MNRTRTMIVTIMVATALFFVGLASYIGVRQNVAVAAADFENCASLRTMLNEEKAALNAAINPLGAYDAETRIAVYETDIQFICGDDKTPEATPSPSATPTTASPSPTPSATTAAPSTATPTAAPTDEYACRPTFYNNQDDKVGVYAFGAPVKQDSLAGVQKELKKRVWCDPALLVQESSKYKIPGVKGLNALERWDLAKKLERQAKKDDQKAWDDLYNSFVTVYDSANNELAYIDPGQYGSFQMVPDAKSGVPRVAALTIDRSTRQKVLRSTLPDGTVINLRLLCGFQPQVQKEKPDVPEIPNIPRDEEGTPKVKACNADTRRGGWTTKPIRAPWTKDWSKCKEEPTSSPTPTPTSPTSTPTATPTPTSTPTSPTSTPTATPTPTPTPTSPSPTPTKPTLEPKPSATSSYTHKPSAPPATVTEPAQTTPPPVETKKPEPTREAPPPPPATGANDPKPTETTCVPAPGKTDC